jgi:hypothetical protein
MLRDLETVSDGWLSMQLSGVETIGASLQDELCALSEETALMPGLPQDVDYVRHVAAVLGVHYRVCSA